jgi:Prolyl 4-Hydroxylase alpha-subunit, N-terminal region.
LERDIEQFLPSASDLNGVAHGISFLCSVYSLPFDEFMRGKILDKQYDAALSGKFKRFLVNSRYDALSGKFKMLVSSSFFFFFFFFLKML